jgi:hypothetical protein
MAGDILTYAPSTVTLVLCGYVLTGIVSVSLQWKSSPFTVRRGIRGQHTRTGSKDRQSTVTIEVLQTSITNDILSEILEQDTRNYSGRLEFSVKDASGTTQWASTQCFLRAWPDASLSGEIQTRKWDVEILSFISGKIGGNARQGFDLLDSFNGAAEYVSSGIDSAVDSASNLFS